MYECILVILIELRTGGGAFCLVTQCFCKAIGGGGGGGSINNTAKIIIILWIPLRRTKD